MREIERFVIPLPTANRVISLCWEGDELVDWARGGERYRLDGSFVGTSVIYAYRFNDAVASDDGRNAIIFEQRGTKALILREKTIVREINRSFYHAGVYEYPCVLTRLRDGRDVIIHCPERYSKLEIEELESGVRLTQRHGEPWDFFHSRLLVSPDGRLLMSAGWFWHPLDEVQIYDIESALAEPETLDQNHRIRVADEMSEVHAAVFSSTDHLVVACELYDDETHFIGTYSLKEGRLISKAPLAGPAGTLMAVGELVIGFFECPKLIATETGRILHEWPEINSGKQNSSIISGIERLPAMALDPQKRRFAVAGPGAITVIQLG